MMRTLVTSFLLAMISSLVASSTVAAENPLTVRMLKTEPSGNYTYLLLQVDNAWDQRFEYTEWSCVDASDD